MATRMLLAYAESMALLIPPDQSLDLHQIPDPSPPPIKEPPEGPENPDVPVREPDPVEPARI